MPSFRNIPLNRHSGRAPRDISDMRGNDKRSVGTPYDRPVKREPSEAVIPPIALSSPPSHSTASPTVVPPTPIASAPCLPSPSDSLSVKLPSARNKKSHSRRREAGYVPRPRNSFIVFRSWWIDKQKESGEGQQNELSKQAGKAWRGMTPAEKQRFKEIAAQEQQIHKLEHPNYQYTPGPRRSISVSRTKSNKSALRKASGSSAGSRKRKAVEATWSVSSATSSEPESPGFMPTTSRVPRKPRAAAQMAVQRLEQIVSLPSPSPPTPQSPPASHHYPTSQEVAPQHSPEAIEDDFVPTDDIPLLELDPHPRTEESKAGEPTFVSDCPPSMNLSAEPFGFPRAQVDSYPHFPILPNINISDLQEMNFDYDWPLTSGPSSPLELAYPLPGTPQRSGSSALGLADPWHRADDGPSNFDFDSWIHLSPMPVQGMAP